MFCLNFGFLNQYTSVDAAAGINRQINFQGKLVSPADGTNVTDGSYSIVFSIYSVSSGGSAIWTETQTPTVTNGIFQVSLGSVTPLPGSVDFNTDNIYLGIKVGADAEMTPRIHFSAVPQAFNSEKLGGLDKDGFIQNSTSPQASSNFNISGTGVVGTSLTTPTLQSAASTALTITGNAASIWSTSSGNLTIQAGSGTVTLGSSTNLTSTGALSVTGGSTLALLTTGANTLRVDTGGAAAINIGDVNSNSIVLGRSGGGTIRVGQNGGTVQIDGTNFDVSTLGVVTLAGAQTIDITTVGAATATAITIQPGTSSGASSNGPALNLKGGDASGTTSVTGGSVVIQAGNATSGSGTRNGGSVTLDAGTGASANGSITIGGTNASAITLGSTTQSGATAMVLGRSTATNTITIGSSAGNASIQTVTIGASATAGSTSNINIGSSIAGTTAITGATTITNRTSGSTDTLLVSNSTSTGTIAVFRDNATAVVTIADGGATTFRNQTNTTTAFQVQNAAGTNTIIGVDTTNLRLGVNTASANTSLDVVGDFALRFGNDYTTTGIQNNVNLGSASSVRYSGAGSATFTGITGGVDGKVLNLHNASAYTVMLSHQSASSTATNRIITGNGSDLYLPPDSSVTMQYDANSDRWRVIGQNGAVATDGPSFSVHKNGTAQTVAANTNVLITWSTERFDSHSDFASNRFTPTVAGKYIVTLAVRCDTNVGNCQAQIWKNGSLYVRGIDINEPSIANGVVSTVIDMNGTTDYLEAYTYTGGTSIDGGSIDTFFTGARIGAGDGSAGSGWTDDGLVVRLSDSTDKVGIGTATPTANLQVNTLTNTTTAFQVQNASNNQVLTVDTTNGQTVLGKASAGGIDGKLVFQNDTNTNTVSLLSGTTGSSYTLTLPTGLGASGDCIKDTTGTGVLGFGSCGTGGVGGSGPSFSVYKTANQTVTSGVDTLLTWSTETFDTNSNFATNRFTPTVAGKYLISGSVLCATLNDQGVCAAKIYKNGAFAYGDYNQQSTATNTYLGSTVTAVVDMNGSTDYVELYANHNSGTPTIWSDSRYTYFNGSLIGGGSEDLQGAYNNSTNGVPAVMATTSTAKTITFKAGSGFDSTTLLQVQNAASKSILTVDTTNGQVVLGTAGVAGVDGKIMFNNDSNSNTVALQSGTTATNYTLTLPTGLGASGDCLKDTTGTGVLGFGSCVGSGGSPDLQGAYNNSTNGIPAAITTSSTAKTVTIKAGIGFDSTGLFRIQDAAADTFLAADSVNKQLILGKSGPSGINGKLLFNNAANANTVGIVIATISSSYTLTLPTSLGASGDCLKQTDGAGSLGFSNCSGVPVGTMAMWPTATPPAGWLILNGSTFNATTYPELNALLGGNTLPDMRQRFPLGVAASGTGSTPLGTGGNIDHAHNMAHTHDVNPGAFNATSGGPSATVTINNGSGSVNSPGNQFHTHTTTIDVPNTTSTQPSTSNTGVANPPFLAVYFIIRAEP